MATTRTGRPRGFDEKAAIDAAMRVFWARSYEGATLDELTAAMGINRSSMYTIFGDKEALFSLTLDHYGRQQAAYMLGALAEPSVEKVLKGVINAMAEFLAVDGNPDGCMSMQAGMTYGATAATINNLMIAFRRQVIAVLENRFMEARLQGDLRADIEPADLASFMAMVIQGMGVQAASGATADEIRRGADLAIRLIDIKASA